MLQIERLPAALGPSEIWLDGVQLASKSFWFSLDGEAHDLKIALS
jgi:hypothetical protein